MSEGLRKVSDFDPRPPELAPVPIDETGQREFAKNVEFWSGALDAMEATGSADISEAAITEYIEGYAPHRPVNDVVQDRTRSRAGVKFERPGMTVICKSLDDLASLVVEKREPQDDSPLDKITRIEYVIDGLDSMTVDGSGDDEITDSIDGMHDGLEPDADGSNPFGKLFGELEEDEDDDGPVCEAVEVVWFIDRESGKVIKSEPVLDVEKHIAFDKAVDVKKRDAADGESDAVDASHEAVITIPKGKEADKIFTHQRLWDTEDAFAALAAGGWRVSLVEQTIKPREIRQDEG